MIKQNHGKVVNIGSVLGKGALNLCLHYGASKAAIMQMTRNLAFEWAPFHVNVNCIAPGFFSTEMTKGQLEDEKQRKFLLRKIPFKRFGKPEEVTGLAIFLSSQASDYITGETVFIDGGYSIW
jgi:NAD(P)-dependent dehydrogenase (short-subunit alcohol dehydrogenase family)